MIVIGLTGSIGMGKSTLTRQLAALGAKTSNSDDIVHRLLANGGSAVAAVQKQFPEMVKKGAVDRKALGDAIFADEKKRAQLESILHPLVIEEEEKFLIAEKAKGAKIIVFDIPLLFETGSENRFDAVIVASAPALIQAQRVLARPFMTPQKFAQILAGQIPNDEKCALADFVVQTGMGRAYSMRKLKNILAELYA